MPLMPATRPLTNANIAAATPIIAPPAMADHGVNEAQSICIGVDPGVWRDDRRRRMRGRSAILMRIGACGEKPRTEAAYRCARQKLRAKQLNFFRRALS